MWSFWSKISGGISDGGAEPFEMPILITLKMDQI